MHVATRHVEGNSFGLDCLKVWIVLMASLMTSLACDMWLLTSCCLSLSPGNKTASRIWNTSNIVHLFEAALL